MVLRAFEKVRNFILKSMDYQWSPLTKVTIGLAFMFLKGLPASFVAKGLEEQWWGGGAGHKTRRVLRRVL